MVSKLTKENKRDKRFSKNHDLVGQKFGGAEQVIPTLAMGERDVAGLPRHRGQRDADQFGPHFIKAGGFASYKIMLIIINAVCKLILGRGLPLAGFFSGFASSTAAVASFGQLAPRELADWIDADRLPVRFQLQLHKLLWNDEPGR